LSLSLLKSSLILIILITTIIYNYIHNNNNSKSGCCYKDFGSKEKNPRASWREEMNAFNIEFPSICLRALLEGYNTCGVENQDAHYSGMLDVRVDGCVD